MEKTLTSRQFSVLAFTAAIAVKMFMLPSLLVAEAGRNGYIWMLVYVAIDLAALALIAVAAVKAKRSFYELTESVLGRIGARVLLVLCAAYILFKMTLMLSEVNVFFSEAMYENFSWPVYLIPLLAVLVYAAARSPRVVGRTAEITLPFVAASMLLLFVLSATKPDYANLLPVLRESRGAVFDYTLWLGDFSPLAVFIGKIERKKRTGTKLMLAGLAAGLAVVAFTVILSAEYGNISGLIEYGHNLGGLPTHSGSQNFSRLDLLVFAVWMTAVFLKLMLYLYAFVRHVLFVLRLNTPAAAYVVSALAVAAVYALSVFVFPTQAAVYGAATGAILRLLALPEQIGIPVVAVTAALVKHVRERRRTHDQS